jgi:hypothetical protein
MVPAMETQTIATPRHATGGLLRFALTLDGVATGANGVLYLAGAPLLDGWLGLPAEMLMAVGAFLIAYAALVLRLATRPAMPRTAVVAVIAANTLWAIDSLLALALDWFTPTTAGQALIALQAVLVAGLAALQYVGLKQAR